MIAYKGFFQIVERMKISENDNKILSGFEFAFYHLTTGSHCD